MSYYDGYDAGDNAAGGFDGLAGDTGGYSHGGDYAAGDGGHGYGDEKYAGGLDGYGDASYADNAYGAEDGYGGDVPDGGIVHDYAHDGYGDGYDGYGGYGDDYGAGYDDLGGGYGNEYDEKLAADEAAFQGYGDQIDEYGHRMGDLATDVAGLAVGDGLGHLAGQVAEHKNGLETAGELGLAALAGGAAGYALGHHHHGHDDGHAYEDGYAHGAESRSAWDHDHGYDAYGHDHNYAAADPGYRWDHDYGYGHRSLDAAAEHELAREAGDNLAESTLLGSSTAFGYRSDPGFGGYDTGRYADPALGHGHGGYDNLGRAGLEGSLNELERLNHLERSVNSQTSLAENALLRDQSRLNEERLEDRIGSRLENRLDARLAHDRLESRLENHLAEERLEDRLEDRLERDRLENKFDSHLHRDILSNDINMQLDIQNLENQVANDRLEDRLQHQIELGQESYYGRSLPGMHRHLGSELAGAHGHDRYMASLDLADSQWARDSGRIRDLEATELARDDARAHSRVDALLLHGSGDRDLGYYGNGYGYDSSYGYGPNDRHHHHHHHFDHARSVLPYGVYDSHHYSHGHRPNVLHDHHRHLHGDSIGSYDAAGRLVGLNPYAGIDHHGEMDVYHGLDGYNHHFDDFYYGGLSNLYTGYVGADLFGGGHGRSRGIHIDPFMNEISLDYGWGRIQPLSRYGLSRTTLKPFDVMRMDDLYLFEQALRADEALDEAERLRRWNERLKWEELSHEQMRSRWQVMSAIDRAHLGLNIGGWWASRFGNHRIDSSYGYSRLLTGQSGLLSKGLRRGSWEHYPLSRTLSTRYPMWKRGGLGLGRSLLNWLHTPSRTYRPSSTALVSRNLQSRHALHRNDLHSRSAALQARNLQSKQANLVAAARAGSSIYSHGIPTHHTFNRPPVRASAPMRPGLSRSRSTGHIRAPTMGSRPPLATRLPHRAPGSAFMRSPTAARLGAMHGRNTSLAARLASLTHKTPSRYGAPRPPPPAPRPGYPPLRPGAPGMHRGMTSTTAPHPGLPRPGLARAPSRAGMMGFGTAGQHGRMPPARGMPGHLPGHAPIHAPGRPPTHSSGSFFSRPNLTGPSHGPSLGRPGGLGGGRSFGTVPHRPLMSASAVGRGLSRDPRLGGGYGYGHMPRGGFAHAPSASSIHRPSIPTVGHRSALSASGRMSLAPPHRGLTSSSMGNRTPGPGYSHSRSLSAGTPHHLPSSSFGPSRVGLPQPPQFAARRSTLGSILGGSRTSLLRPTPLTPGGSLARSASALGSRTPLQSVLKSPGAGLSAKSPLLGRTMTPGPTLRPRASTMSMRARSPAPSLRAKSPAPSIRAKSPAPSFLRAKSPAPSLRPKSPFRT